MNRIFRSAIFYLVLIIAVVWVFNIYRQSAQGPEQIDSVNTWVGMVEDKDIDTAKFLTKDEKVTGDLSDGTGQYEVFLPHDTVDDFANFARKNGVDVSADPQMGSFLLSVLFQFLPILIIVGFFFFLMQQMQGGGNRVMSFGKSKARLVTKDQPKITFSDVAGLDEAVEELEEIKEFLQAPQKFQAMGAKIPKGVLLFGPPGTGKTLLARAVAGEAGVPFFSISGSDFVEMFVGVGASRVRDLFEQAKSNAPSIVFMDEIDAVGRHRGAGLGGGHDEREQTLNQLLVEMDGFDVKGGVILIAATNRPDILDPALLRPGRFDRQIVVDRPDLNGRTGILKVHTRGKPLAKDIDVEVLARRTPGFTGADLANVVNEAALLAARFSRSEIGMGELEEAIDRVLAGPERRSRVISEKERKVIAYHEAGHALVSHALPNADPVHKVSIVSRGRALGYTLNLPTEDRFLVTRSELIDQLAMLLGGRVAEETVFDEPTTGAQDDIQRCTRIARQMVTEFGMSELGPLALGQNESQPFLGRDFGHVQDYSDVVAAKIDREVSRLVDEAHDEARDIVTKYRDKLDAMVARLLEKESLERSEVSEILAEVAKQSPANPIERRRLRRKAQADGQTGETQEEPQPGARRARRTLPAPKPSWGEA
ncbi:MAG: ATP-dependent metallopeptidase FtsH/Yme1/Tma family protein [Actinobacteria bacterium]|nr:ATP-dependent metallopeptidase FtsH/Yme1/Tma family protein [Actinomycetota bacterium]MDQ3532403.1 ATP-dependent zinc metalloprotease FtsH [Actinomycetota bacterium]